jgi:glycolate oxidase FAD binding subunit
MPGNVTGLAPPALSQREEALRAIVGAGHVRLQQAAGMVAAAPPAIFVEPGNEEEVAAVLQWANRSGLVVAPCGGGSKLSWGNPPARMDLMLSTLRLNRILEHAWADLTVTVEAGCRMRDLQEALAQHGQRLALDVLWPERATVGGVLSANDSGALRLRFGSPRDLIIGVTLALADGTVASSGGKVVKNVAGYDLPKLATGALGTLGVITRAVFRVHPLPRTVRTYSVAASDSSQMQQLIFAVQDSKLSCTSLQVRCGEDALPELDIGFEGSEKMQDGQLARLRTVAQSMLITPAEVTVWRSREQLWSEPQSGSIVKISMLPGNLERNMEAVRHLASASHLHWRAVLQATGLGWLRVEGAVDATHSVLRELRRLLEKQDGSLVVLSQPSHTSQLEAWGTTGDQQPLMVAIKKQFDPGGTLNPGRFAGGI